MKLKRLFAAVLSTALALSLCAMPAMATEGGTTAGTPLADGMPVWDTTQKGSITIHKFEYNPSSGATFQQGTGAEGEAAPLGAKPLGGVTFEIYKVQNEEWLKAYYGGQAAATGQDFSNIDASNYYSTNSTTGAITVNGSKIDTVTTATSGTDIGVAKKDGLALGLYLVVETSAPDKVTSPAAPFLVSVPMTRIADTTTTNKLTDWIYDVHVYPKNSTTYGQVTIEKKGYTGGGTGVALEGVQFKLQKQNGADWTDITANDSNGSTYNLTTDINGKITIAGLSQGNYRIFEDAYSGDSANKGYILDAAYHTFTVQKNGQIQVDGNVSANATIQVANHRPDMKKEVKKGDSWAQDAPYGVDDTVPYKITIEVPQNIDKLSTFTVTDTPTGLKDNVGSIKIKDGTTALTSGTDYTVAAEGTDGFKIDFILTSNTVKACAGHTVTITYNAVVKDTAVVGGNGNSNNAKLTYTNKINSDNTPGTTTNTIEDSAVMYSFGIKVVKTAEDGNTPLPGVVFDLYREAKTGETSIVDAETVKKAGLDSTKSWILVKSGLTTNASGIIDTSDSTNATNYTHGLANGDYYLVETKTVDGYNLLTKPVEVKLDVTATTTWQKTNVYDASGNLVKHGTVTKTTFTHTSNNGDATKTELAVAKVINRKGFTLPVTGGFGTLLFSGIGVLLVLAGVGVLFSLKKKSNRA